PVLRFAGGIAFHREYRDLSEERVRFITRLEAGSGVCFAGEADLYPVRIARYEQLHAATGFAELGRHGDFRGAPYGASSPACVLTFERKSQSGRRIGHAGIA
ncbi:MAG: hypothetical protein V1774_04020, partial [Candidatus Eisenbacteria bacterium]